MTFRSAPRLAFWASIACFAQLSSAAAQPAPLPEKVLVVLGDCESSVARKPLLEQLRVELVSLGVGSVTAADAGADLEPAQGEAAVLHVEFRDCGSADSDVGLRVVDPSTRSKAEREMVISDVPQPIRPRAVALASAELLRASWTEVHQRAPAKPRPLRPEATRALPTSAARTQDVGPAVSVALEEREERQQEEELARFRHARLDWTAAGRFFPQGGAGDVSTSVTSSIALTSWLRLHVGGLVASGGAQHPASDPETFEVGGRAGVGITAGHALALELAPAIEVGYAHLRAKRAADATSVLTLALLQATLRAPITNGLDALVGVLGGVVMTPLEALEGGQVVAGLRGPMLGISAGLSGIFIGRRVP